VVPSPDGTLQAVLYTDAGGGEAGWCYHRVALRTARDSGVDLARSKPPSNFLFQASCGSNVHIGWRGPAELHVSYTVSQYGVTVYQSTTGNNGKVRVTYEVAEH